MANLLNDGKMATKRITTDSITPQSVQDQAAEWIRNAILDGDFQIGEKLVEGDIAEQIGVSRIPVRAALQQLVTEGLVDHIPRVGRFTHIPTVEEVQDVQEIRGMLEGLAVRKLALRAAEEDDHSWIDALDAINHAMQDALAASDHAAYFSLSRSFHERLVQLNDSDILSQFHDFVMNRAALFRRLSGATPSRQEDALEEHAAIVAAIREGKPDLAEQLMRTHSVHGAVAIQNVLREKRLSAGME